MSRLSRSTATLALCPVNHLLLLLRPWRCSGSVAEGSRPGAVPSLIAACGFRPGPVLSATSCSSNCPSNVCASRTAGAFRLPPAWAQVLGEPPEPPGVGDDLGEKLVLGPPGRTSPAPVLPLDAARREVTAQVVRLPPRPPGDWRRRCRQGADQLLDAGGQQVIGIFHRAPSQDRLGIQRRSAAGPPFSSPARRASARLCSKRVRTPSWSTRWARKSWKVLLAHSGSPAAWPAPPPSADRRRCGRSLRRRSSRLVLQEGQQRQQRRRGAGATEARRRRKAAKSSSRKSRSAARASWPWKLAGSRPTGRHCRHQTERVGPSACRSRGSPAAVPAPPGDSPREGEYPQPVSVNVTAALFGRASRRSIPRRRSWSRPYSL